nr:Uncharacterised protein [Raoultella sp. NCTC 9187]
MVAENEHHQIVGTVQLIVSQPETSHTVRTWLNFWFTKMQTAGGWPTR